MVLYAKIVRWERWNRYDWFWPTGKEEPKEVTPWYHEDDLPKPPFEAPRHQDWFPRNKFVKQEDLHEFGL